MMKSSNKRHKSNSEKSTKNTVISKDKHKKKIEPIKVVIIYIYIYIYKLKLL